MTKVFLDITKNGKDLGRITINLFTDKVPKTAENFRALCTGEKGLSYKGTNFLRIIPCLFCEGGDVAGKLGGKSIYGDKFDDENFSVPHSKKGLVAMSSAGRNSNASRFFISLTALGWLNGKNVVFGEVSDGMHVVDIMEDAGSAFGKPSAEFVIANCGEL